MFGPVSPAQGAFVLDIFLAVFTTHHLLDLVHSVGLALETTFAVLVGVVVDEAITHNTQGEGVPVLRLGFILLVLVLGGLCGTVKIGDSGISDGFKTAGLLSWDFAALYRSFLLLADNTGARGLGDAREALVIIAGRGIVLDLNILNALFWFFLFLVYGKLTAAVVLNRLAGGVFTVSKRGTFLERGSWFLGGSDSRIIIRGSLLWRRVCFPLPVLWIVATVAEVLGVLGETRAVVGDLGERECYE